MTHSRPARQEGSEMTIRGQGWACDEGLDTTQPAGERQQLWSDNKIANALQHRSWYLDKHQRILAIEYATAFGVAIKMRDEYEAERATLQQENARLAAELAERQASFDLRWDADMRAIAMWQEATGEELKWPNHVDLCVWLMEKLAAMRASAWLVDMLNDYRGDGMDDLQADVIEWRQWLGAEASDNER